MKRAVVSLFLLGSVGCAAHDCDLERVQRELVMEIGTELERVRSEPSFELRAPTGRSKVLTPRCKLCNRFLGDFEVLVSSHQHGEFIAGARGQCKEHALVDARQDSVGGWEDYFPHKVRAVTLPAESSQHPAIRRVRGQK